MGTAKVEFEQSVQWDVVEPVAEASEEYIRSPPPAMGLAAYASHRVREKGMLEGLE
jgi:hypothetical protein